MKRSSKKKRTRPAPRGRWLAGVFAACGLAALLGWNVVRSESPPVQNPARIAYEVVGRYPHDPDAYTQGLYYEGGYLFEGTGRNGKSFLRKVDLETGAVLQQSALPRQFFGEGIAALGSRIYQLTWLSEQGFIYDRATFTEIGRFRYRGQGWGLTEDGRSIIMSDGSPNLRFFDPESFAEVRRVQVHGPSGPIDQLNELEYIDGDIWANVWHTDRILRISPETGAVLGELDLAALAREVRVSDPEGVLNGIAYDAATGRVFVTGKLWPTVFELRVEGIDPK